MEFRRDHFMFGLPNELMCMWRKISNVYIFKSAIFTQVGYVGQISSRLRNVYNKSTKNP